MITTADQANTALADLQEAFTYSAWGPAAPRGGIDWAAEERHEDHILRYQIHHHQNNWPESTAVAEVWSPRDLAWHEIVTCQTSQWASRREGLDGGEAWLDSLSRSHREPPGPVQLTSAMVDAMLILRQRAHAILS